MSDSIRGYRPGTEGKPSKVYSVEYLKLKPESARKKAALDSAIAEKGANCLEAPEFFTGDDLPTDRRAQLACAGCPVYDLCDAYAKAAHPAWGVLAGRVYGRTLAEKMKDGEDET